MYLVAISAALQFVKGLDDRILRLLRDFSLYPNKNKDVVRALDDFRVIDFYSFSRKAVLPHCFPVMHCRNCSHRVVQRWFVSEGSLKRVWWQRVDDDGVNFYRFRILEFVEDPHHIVHEYALDPVVAACRLRPC